MSSMLEQAIVDAAALREAALKNAEQSIIEKYAPQIKEAVDSLLDKDVIQEQSIATTATSETPMTSIEAPFAASPMDNPNKEVELTLTDDDQTWEFDLNQIKQEMAASGGMEEPTETTEDLMGDLGLGDEGTPEEPLEDEGELALQEVMKILNELSDEETSDEKVLEEELVVDMAGDAKGGWIETNTQELKYRQESNQTLSDASLNERQKNKIVEAIAKAKTPEEAKNLQEALKTTVGTSKTDGPKSLSESVNRRSNLSGIMPRRKKPEQEFSFANQMKKLAGIK